MLVVSVQRVPPALPSVQPLRSLVERVVFLLGLLILLLALHPELLRYAEPFEEGLLPLLKVSNHDFLPLPLLEFLPEFLLLVLLKLL